MQLVMECALGCLAQCNQRPNDPEQHRISVEFLSPAGRWRDEVIRLSQRAPLHTLSFPLIQRCVELGLVPCVERVMESRHAYVQQRLRLGKKRGVSASVCSLASGRMLELERRLLYYPFFGRSLMHNT